MKTTTKWILGILGGLVVVVLLVLAFKKPSTNTAGNTGASTGATYNGSNGSLIPGPNFGTNFKDIVTGIKNLFGGGSNSDRAASAG